MSDIVLSMATMPSRKKRLLENIPSLVNEGQTYDGFTIRKARKPTHFSRGMNCKY